MAGRPQAHGLRNPAIAGPGCRTAQRVQRRVNSPGGDMRQASFGSRFPPAITESRFNADDAQAVRGSLERQLGGRQIHLDGGRLLAVLVEFDRDDFRDPRLFHRHPVENVGLLHGATVVRDDQELGV